MKGPSVVAVAGDAGGASALAPVLEGLRQEAKVRLEAMAYREARTVWAPRGIPFTQLPETMAPSTVSTILQQRSASLVLAATSHNGIDLEKHFINAARRLRIPSVAVLDFWSNYRLRFIDATGRELILPDRVAVMDESAKVQMVQAGFEENRLRVTGQPAFDDLARIRADFGPSRRTRIRAQVGVREGERFVLFASQPIATLFGADASHPRYPGYSEKSVVPLVRSALERIARRRGVPILFGIRPHPREDPREHLPSAGSRVRTLVLDFAGTRELALASDLVVGMNTVFLIEASLMGCPTISVQPGLRLPEVLPLHAHKGLEAIYIEGNVEAGLERRLFGAAAPEENPVQTPEAPGGATASVMELVYEMVGLGATPDVTTK